MPKYRMTCYVTLATGTQTYTAEADTPEEALEILKAGDAKFEDEQLEVQDFDLPEGDEIELAD